MYSLSAIVPFYNEQKTLKKSVIRLINTNLFDEVILIDDNSSDESSRIAQEIESNFENVKYFKKRYNEGKGSAVIYGFTKISSSHVIVHDADLEYDPNDIKKLKNLSFNNKDALILGSRNIGDQNRVKQYKHLVIGNKIISKFFSIINNIEVSDISTCYMLYSNKFIKKANISEKKFGIEIEILSKFAKSKNKIIETSINYSGRSYSEGKKITIKDGVGIFLKVIKYKIQC